MEAFGNFLGGALVLFLGFILFHFKTVDMIAGYNTASAKEKARYDKEKLSKYVGGMLLIGGAILLLSGGLFLLLREMWIILGSWLLFVVFLIGGVIYLNMGQRMYKEEYRKKKL